MTVADGVAQPKAKRFRMSGHDGIYWIYPVEVPDPYGSRMDGAVGIATAVFRGWVAEPVRGGTTGTKWAWRAPTRKQALDQLLVWLNTNFKERDRV